VAIPYTISRDVARSGRLVSLRPTGALRKRIAPARGIMHHG
jgi:hypothetical protein